MSADQAETLATAADLILPPTDTPGARAAGVHEFIDMMLADFHDDDFRTTFMAGVDALDAAAQAEHGAAFVGIDPAQQIALLEQMEASEDPFWPVLKQQVIVGYYTSEVGAMEELQYLRVPGRFEGCTPLSEAGSGRTWAA
ncbi:MAG: lactose 3-dehydrogenase subunit gamma LacC [Rhodothermales bacterium]